MDRRRQRDYRRVEARYLQSGLYLVRSPLAARTGHRCGRHLCRRHVGTHGGGYPGPTGRVRHRPLGREDHADIWRRRVGRGFHPADVNQKLWVFPVGFRGAAFPGLPGRLQQRDSPRFEPVVS